MNCRKQSPLVEFFRCPPWFTDTHLLVRLNGDLGAALGSARPHDPLWRDAPDRWLSSAGLREWADLLRYELYEQASTETTLGAIVARELYYLIRPLLGVTVRRHFQKLALRGWSQRSFPRWPIDRSVDQLHEYFLAAGMERKHCTRVPFIWFWPSGYRSCAMLTHDVETEVGLEFCPTLMDLDDAAGFKSAFELIPEQRYRVSPLQLQEFRDRGFEINVHDLNHDGHLFRDRETFRRRVERINEYGKEFGALGFRSGALYRNQSWYESLAFRYDMSVPNVAHLDPQHGGCCTLFPYFIGDILEMPVTAIQDYSLFHVVGTYSIDLWRQQMSTISSHHGLINVITHPDYLIEQRARKAYRELLEYMSDLKRERAVWTAQPRDVDVWWRQRAQLELAWNQDHWTIVGEGSERAEIAYFELGEDQQVVYCVGDLPS